MNSETIISHQNRMLWIAVPSYQRPQVFREKTYALLQRHNLLCVTTVFVVEEEKDLYALPGITVVVGKKGLLNQRKVIYDYYPTGSWIVQIDDDVSSVIGMNRKEVPCLMDVLKKGFHECVKEKAYLWGIYPIANPFFMKETVTTDLRHIVGCFWGVIKDGAFLTGGIDDKEDYYRSCSYYKRDGKVVRLNSFAPKTNYYTTKGGMRESQTIETILQAAIAVQRDFKDWVRIYTRKRTGFAEIRLKANPL